MSEPIILHLQLKNELVEIVIRVLHPMDAGGTLHPKTGRPVPPDFLQTIAIQLNERTLLEGQLGPALARNPEFRFSFRGAKTGDKFLVACTDNRGRSFEQRIAVPAFNSGLK